MLQGMAQNRDTSLLARAATIELVLGTDMKKHFNILSLFQVRHCWVVAARMLVAIWPDTHVALDCRHLKTFSCCTDPLQCFEGSSS